MKSFAVALAAAVALAFPLVAGCGGESSNMQAQYPATPPVGADTPEQLTAEAASGADGEVAVDAENAAPADASYAAPQAGDIQVGADDNQYADTDPSALTDFKPALDPYGTWVDDSTYGTVWTPSPTVVGDDFAPYVTAGHWAYDTDWVWVSDYDWGWAPFHYGRWVYISGRGWGWIPGRTYAGAWVTWRYGYDDWGYVGWAPMPPAWYWHGGIAVGFGYVPVAPYVFCHRSYVFYGGGLHHHIVTGPQVAVVAAHTRPYVPASPTVGAHGFAHPTVGGPPPRSLGIANPPGSGNNRGLARAQQFANPQSATAVGAHAPAQVIARSQAPQAPSSPRAPGAGFAQRGPVSLGQSHAPTVTAPQYRGVAPTPHPAPYTPSARSYTASPSVPHYTPSPSVPHYSPSPSVPHYTPSPSVPHYSPSPSVPHYSPSPSVPHATPSAPMHVPAPSYHVPAPSHPSGGAVRGGGSVRGGRR